MAYIPVDSIPPCRPAYACNNADTGLVTGHPLYRALGCDAFTDTRSDAADPHTQARTEQRHGRSKGVRWRIVFEKQDKADQEPVNSRGLCNRLPQKHAVCNGCGRLWLSGKAFTARLGDQTAAETRANCSSIRLTGRRREQPPRQATSAWCCDRCKSE